MNDEQTRAEASSYEDEVSSRRTVTIPLREYDELKAEQGFIKDCSSFNLSYSLNGIVTVLCEVISSS